MHHVTLTVTQEKYSRSMFDQTIRHKQTLQEMFGKWGITPPPVPPEFAPRLRQAANTCFSTRPGKFWPPYYFLDYQDIADVSATDWLVIGFSGHGINSYGLSYYLKCGQLTLLLQFGWGGWYCSDSQTTRHVSSMFEVLVEHSHRLTRLNARLDHSDLHLPVLWKPSDLTNFITDSPLNPERNQ